MNRGEAMDAILDSNTTAVQVAILLGYMRHMPSGVAVEQGVSWPGPKTLARYAGTTRSTVIRQRTALMDAGVLVDAGTPKGGTPHLRIDFEALACFAARKVKRRTPTREERWGSTDGDAGSSDNASGSTDGGAPSTEGRTWVSDHRTGEGVSDSRTGRVPSSDTGVSDSRSGRVPSSDTNPLKEPSEENPPKEPSAVPPQSPPRGGPVSDQAPPERTPAPIPDAPPPIRRRRRRGANAAVSAPEAEWTRRGLPAPDLRCRVDWLGSESLDVWERWRAFTVDVEAVSTPVALEGGELETITDAVRELGAEHCIEVLDFAFNGPDDDHIVAGWRQHAARCLRPSVLLGRQRRRNSDMTRAWVRAGKPTRTPNPSGRSRRRSRQSGGLSTLDLLPSLDDDARRAG